MIFRFGGGINELNDINISPEEAIAGQNFELGLGNTKLKRRPPFDLVGTAPNTSEIHGIHQLIERDGTKTTLIVAGTDVYTFDGTTFVDVGNVSASSEFHDFSWDLDETIIIVDRAKIDVVKEWDGTTFSDFTTGLGVNFFAKYGLVANGRAMFANVTTGTTSIPHMFVLSAFEDRNDLDTSARAGGGGFATGNEAAFLLSPDLRPINGFIEFQQDIVISTEGGKLYRLVGSDSNDYNFVSYYAGSSAAGDNSFVNANDDIYYLRTGGVIESLRATDRYGDVGTDDISLPIRETIQDEINTRVVYDQGNKKVFWFFSNKIVVLFKNLIGSPLSPFSIYKTLHPSSFSTRAVRYMVNPTVLVETSSVYWGDAEGNLFDMNGMGLDGDAGAHEIEMNRKLPLQGASFDDFVKGRIFYRRKGQCDLNMLFEWGDEKSETNLTVRLKGDTLQNLGNFYGGDQYYGGDFYYSEGILGAGNPVSKGFSAIGQGSSVFVTFGITTSEEFEIDFIQTPGEDEE